MANFITVSSQDGSSKTLVNVDSLNRVSYHLSSTATRVVENYYQYGALGLFKNKDFYSVLDVNGSNINSLDSISEIEDKLSGVIGAGHGMTYVPHALIKANEEVLSDPYLLASYLSSFTDFLYKGKVFRGSSKEVNLAWTDEMVSKVLSLYKVYINNIPNDFSYEFAFPLGCYLSNSFEIIKGKPSVGIPVEIAKHLKVNSEYGMVLSTLSSFDLKYPQVKRCVYPNEVAKESKGGVVGISDYTSVLIDFQFSVKVVVDAETFIKYLVSIIKQANGVECAEKFLEDLFDIFCTSNHKDLFSYFVSYTASEYVELDSENCVSLESNNIVKGDYVYVPLPKIFGGAKW